MEILPNSLERETGQVSYGMPGQGRPLHPQHFELPHQGVERQSGPFPSLTNLIPDQVADPNSSIASTTSELKEAKEEEGEKKGDKKTKKDKKDKSDFQTVYRKTKKSSIHRFEYPFFFLTSMKHLMYIFLSLKTNHRIVRRLVS